MSSCNSSQASSITEALASHKTSQIHENLPEIQHQSHRLQQHDSCDDILLAMICVLTPQPSWCNVSLQLVVTIFPESSCAPPDQSETPRRQQAESAAACALSRPHPLASSSFCSPWLFFLQSGKLIALCPAAELALSTCITAFKVKQLCSGIGIIL